MAGPFDPPLFSPAIFFPGAGAAAKGHAKNKVTT
jgi:hypothetical protein